MTYGVYDIRGVWLFDFVSDKDEPSAVAEEARQKVDPEAYRAVLVFDRPDVYVAPEWRRT